MVRFLCVKLPRQVRIALVASAWALVPLLVLGTNQQCSVAAVWHRPCPGCGLTRATRLMLHGDVAGSLHMHPLAVPMILCWGAIALATVVSTWREGVPWQFHRSRLGRAALIATATAYVALVVVWALRERGLLGGPVSV